MEEGLVGISRKEEREQRHRDADVRVSARYRVTGRPWQGWHREKHPQRSTSPHARQLPLLLMQGSHQRGPYLEELNRSTRRQRPPPLSQGSA